MDPRTPVLIGAGQFISRDPVTNADGQPVGRDPIELMVEALRDAAAKSGGRNVLSSLQSIAAVPTISWRYSDPAAAVGRQLGAHPVETVLAPLGGHAPTYLLNRAARAIQAGTLDCAAVVGGEAWRTRSAFRRAGSKPPWWSQPDSEVPTEFPADGPDAMFHPAELAVGLVMPTQFYPLFENALRHESGRSTREHAEWVASWWAPMSEVAARNPYAVRQQPVTPAEVLEVSDTNRMVGYPYTKRMVSNPDVDMAAGFIICSAAKATELGVSRNRWIFPHAGTDGTDRYPSNRKSFTTSASMRVAGRRVLELAERSIADIDLLDIYSCFPSAIEIAAKEIGIPLDRPLTVYGGLCFAGGPWNNPVNHALAAMTDALLNGQGQTGLVTSNGGNIGKHGFVVLGADPAPHEFRWDHPQAEIDDDGEVPVEIGFVGSATIETWTVMFGRDGNPESTHAAVRTDSGSRAWALSTDSAIIDQFLAADPIGSTVEVRSGHQIHIS